MIEHRVGDSNCRDVLGLGKNLEFFARM